MLILIPPSLALYQLTIVRSLRVFSSWAWVLVSLSKPETSWRRQDRILGAAFFSTLCSTAVYECGRYHQPVGRLAGSAVSGLFPFS